MNTDPQAVDTKQCNVPTYVYLSIQTHTHASGHTELKELGLVTPQRSSECVHTNHHNYMENNQARALSHT